MLGLEVQSGKWTRVFFGIFEDIKLGTEIGGVVGTADQGAASYVAKSFIERDLLVFGKAVWMDVFDDGQVAWCGAQVLAEGQNSDIGSEEVIHRRKNFFGHFAETEHEATLGSNFAIDHSFGFFQNSKAAMILGARANKRC